MLDLMIDCSCCPKAAECTKSEERHGEVVTPEDAAQMECFPLQERLNIIDEMVMRSMIHNDEEL